MESVRSFAKKVQERFSAIHVLINNGRYTLVAGATISLIDNILQLVSCLHLIN